MNNTIKFSVDVKNNGKRLDIFLREKLKDFTRSYLKKIIVNKHVKLNSSILTVPSTKIRIKDEIVINKVDNKIKSLKPKKINLDIIFEDKDISSKSC